MVLATSPVFGRETGNHEKIVAGFEAKSLDLASPVLLTIDDYNKLIIDTQVISPEAIVENIQECCNQMDDMAWPSCHTVKITQITHLEIYRPLADATNLMNKYCAAKMKHIEECYDRTQLQEKACMILEEDKLPSLVVREFRKNFDHRGWTAALQLLRETYPREKEWPQLLKKLDTNLQHRCYYMDSGWDAESIEKEEKRKWFSSDTADSARLTKDSQIQALTEVFEAARLPDDMVTTAVDLMGKKELGEIWDLLHDRNVLRRSEMRELQDYVVTSIIRGTEATLQRFIKD